MTLPSRRPRSVTAVVALALVVTGCALFYPEAPPPPAAAPPGDFPEAHYRDMLAAGNPVYRVDATESVVAVEVRRGGSLARLGHDHIVASHAIGGYVAPQEGRADLYVQLATLAVDEPALRAETGFDTQPSASDISGTRANMLDKVLEADKYPYALIEVRGARQNGSEGELSVSLALHGVTRRFEVPVKIDADSGTVETSGRLSFRQTDFGMTPYSLLGGAIAVQDRLDLRFRIRARRI